MRKYQLVNMLMFYGRPGKDRNFSKFATHDNPPKKSPRSGAKKLFTSNIL